MRSTLLAAAAVALALPIAAHAAPNAVRPTRSTHVTGKAISADLKKAGFTNIQVKPVAFVARAKDKDGRMVLMAFRPHSFEAVTQLKANGPNTDNGNNGQTTGTNGQTNGQSNNSDNSNNTNTTK